MKHPDIPPVIAFAPVMARTESIAGALKCSWCGKMVRQWYVNLDLSPQGVCENCVESFIESRRTAQREDTEQDEHDRESIG